MVTHIHSTEEETMLGRRNQYHHRRKDRFDYVNMNACEASRDRNGVERQMDNSSSSSSRFCSVPRRDYSPLGKTQKDDWNDDECRGGCDWKGVRERGVVFGNGPADAEAPCSDALERAFESLRSDRRVALSAAAICLALTWAARVAPGNVTPFFFGTAYSAQTGEASANSGGFGVRVVQDVSDGACPRATFVLERHDHESQHGDVCRGTGGSDFACPVGCRKGSGPPFCLATGDEYESRPCRVPRSESATDYRCDVGGGERGVCIKAVGPPHEFKGEGVYADDVCGGKCGGSGEAGSGGGRDVSSERSWLSWGGGGGRGGSFRCEDGWDCSLAGECVGGSCVCDDWAEGIDCSYLRFRPIDKSRLGYLHDVHTSWGGNAVRGSDGLWHMYVAEIACGPDDVQKVKCGLSKWQTHSQVAHVTSPNVDGPYQRDIAVLPPEAHNPTLKVSPVDGSWSLYYISGGSGPIQVISSNDEGRTWTPPTQVSKQQNPGPLMNDDGTVTMYYRGDNGDLPPPTCSTEYIGVQHCPSRTEPCSDESNTRAFNHTAEDPSVFQDHRGNYHMLVNALPYLCVPKLRQGGHAWSRDGVSWSEPRLGAYDTTLRFDDGSEVQCERRERPQMILNPEGGAPVALVSAVTGCPRKFGDNYRGGDDSFTVVQLMGGGGRSEDSL